MSDISSSTNSADEIEARIVGTSPRLRRTLALAREIAVQNCSVLICGETGVGKENIARIIHAASGRPGFLNAFNCAAVASDIAESELFGHARGAFTNAYVKRPGLVAESDRGTLFLDEVEELAPDLQAKLLRVLQERCIRPVGDDRERPIDLRVIAATNADLLTAMREKRFRRDLYHRLAGFVLEVPPLRDRATDVILIARHFLREMTGGAPPILGRDAETVLRTYNWPGNVRELEQVIRAVIVGKPGARIQARHILSALNLEVGLATRDLPQQILQLITRQQTVIVEELCVEFRVSRATVYRALDQLREDGKVARAREGQQAVYRLADVESRALVAVESAPETPGKIGQDSGQFGSLEARVLELAATGVTRGVIMDRLGVPPRTASRVLTRLEADGLLMRRGSGRYQKYVLRGVFEINEEK